VVFFLLVQHQSLDNILLTPSRHPDVLSSALQATQREGRMDRWVAASLISSDKRFRA
jgi:hypothetical protein